MESCHACGMAALFYDNEVKTHNFKVQLYDGCYHMLHKKVFIICRFSKTIISFIQICAEKPL